VSADAFDEKLREAASCYDDTEKAEELLWTALRSDPQCLGSYFSLYKFYFYKRMLREAEGVALLGLGTAARLGNFTSDWTLLNAQTVDWRRIDAPQHFFLFTLKALAFMRLRLGYAEESHAILAKLLELDPHDSVGASVIRDLAACQTH
jgi:hypothetical protein